MNAIKNFFKRVGNFIASMINNAVKFTLERTKPMAGRMAGKKAPEGASVLKDVGNFILGGIVFLALWVMFALTTYVIAYYTTLVLLMVMPAWLASIIVTAMSAFIGVRMYRGIDTYPNFDV